jgi:hypothetical protein
MLVFSRQLFRRVICLAEAALVDMPLQVQLMPLLAAAALQPCTNILAFVDTGQYLVVSSIWFTFVLVCIW